MSDADDILFMIEHHRLCVFWDEPMSRWQINAHNRDDACATGIDLRKTIMAFCVNMPEAKP